MSWIKSLWDKVVNKTSTSPTLVVVEEQQIDVRKVFEHYCRSKGVKQADLDSVNAGAIFEEWYDGEATEDAIKQSIQEFKQVMGGGINAKLNKLQ